MTETTEQQRQRFRERYLVSGSDALLDAEMEVLGSDYQANGYTTMAQANELGRLLQLGAGDRLLDLGAGCGWPGLHLARRHGCEVVGTDSVSEGAAVAGARAKRDGITGWEGFLQATASELPLRPASFDAVVHTDVVC